MLPDDEAEPTLHMTLSMCQCPGHPHRHLSILSHLLVAVAPSVRDLVIDDCLCQSHAALDEAVCRKIMQHFRCLASLTLDHVDFHRLKRKTVRDLSEWAGPNLIELNCEDCVHGSSKRSYLDDGFFGVVAYTSPGLRRVQLTSCDSITNTALFFLAWWCPGLDYLDVSGCSFVTASGIWYFLIRMLPPAAAASVGLVVPAGSGSMPSAGNASVRSPVVLLNGGYNQSSQNEGVENQRTTTTTTGAPTADVVSIKIRQTGVRSLDLERLLHTNFRAQTWEWFPISTPRPANSGGLAACGPGPSVIYFHVDPTKRVILFFDELPGIMF
jgi:hypothetical protein